MPKVQTLDIRLYADRNFPVAQVKIPENLIYDYNELFAAAQEQFPAYTHEALIRYMWVAGIEKARGAVATKGLADPNRTPEPRIKVPRG